MVEDLSNLATDKAGGVVDSAHKAEVENVQWTVHLARNSSGKTVGLVAVLVAAAVLAYLLMGQWVAVLVALLCLVGSTTEFLFPLTFVLDNRGAWVKGVGISRSMVWDAVKRIDVGQGRIHLSPFRVPTRLDRFRGVELRFDGTRPNLQEEVMRRLRTRLPEVAA